MSFKGPEDFEVLVIGGGHAGCEAAYSSARLGRKTAMLTLNPSRIGFMSCNPAIGGLAKGQLVKEIDALGGIMGLNTDRSAIQFKRLNSSKGPAVRSSRAQCDKALYSLNMQSTLRELPGLSIVEAEATKILIEGLQVVGVELRDGSQIRARAVVITSGTFLQAIMHTGLSQQEGGRLGDVAAKGLSGSLRELGFRLSRLKTGTPPRLHRNSLDYSKMAEQFGDAVPSRFSFYDKSAVFPYLPQVACHITYTNEKTHEWIEKNFDRSPMFTGIIQGVGPRYCPSIEDKVKRFRERDRHQIFVEPEGLTTDEMYINGISTSLPADVQEQFVRTIVGLENAQFIKFGYAVEYDAVDARQLRATLESKDWKGLFCAGQINGTSGYEEAGAQGLIAGINAALSVRDSGEFILSRIDGYIGVLIDDLILKGADEPYRMFTSRAEYRLLLREDNADLRLSPRAIELGILDSEQAEIFYRKQEAIQSGREQIRNRFFYPTEKTNRVLAEAGSAEIRDKISAEVLLKRPEMDLSKVQELSRKVAEGEEDPRPVLDLSGVSTDAIEQIEIQVKYEGYIQRDLELLEGLRKSEEVLIPSNLDFSLIPGLSAEIQGRLRVARPETLGQASRLPGVTPAAMANLMIFMKMNDRQVAQ
ncbi:MAG: tRNA uridine-5-carboxymethylaminomethyl(34) synthesis enzyme MnmG [Bdellovibrionales bacterium]|nr:tRNA uridine-5-carboxymethylaminomethyl(34) synthesis enzyme MnmG [Bdellovibrionales bacterium]